MYGAEWRWPAERDERLKDCIEQKLSAGQAARQLRVTRGAAIGRARRMGLRFDSGIRCRRAAR